MGYAFIALLLLVTILAVPLAALVIAVVQWVNVRTLSRRVAYLEARLKERDEPAIETGGREQAEAVAQEHPLPDLPVVTEEPIAIQALEPIAWELLIGRKALGWVAVALFILAAAFFLKFAYDNNWIGPQGQVAAAAMAGAALMIAGWSYHRRDWRIFSQMLTATGVVVLYLTTYASFGFYHLLPQQIAAGLLAVIVIESALLALRYDSLAVALTAVLGGLMTPVLMQSDYDLYVQLFVYLSALNLGIVLLTLVRSWPALGTLGLLGTQALFWQWYHGYYHPEKLGWTIGFQAVLYAMYLGQTILLHVVRDRRATWEDVARVILNASLWFLAVYALLRPDYRPWLGSAAIGLAVVYAVLARLLLACRPRDARPLLAAIAVSAGFIALAFPLEAEASWIAFGWAAEAAMLWWFGQRVGAPALRLLAAALAGAALVRVVGFDLPGPTTELFVPVFNQFALPAVGVAASLLTAIALTRRATDTRHALERYATVAFAGLVLLYLWLILSLDCYRFFHCVARLPETNRERWMWLGQMAVSIFSAVYATALMGVGFWKRITGLRVLALLIYALTVFKVLIVDLSESSYLYRVLALLVVGLLIGAAAWAYQRVHFEQASGQPDAAGGGGSDASS